MPERAKPRPHYALPGNVYETALNRIRWLFEEFNGNVTVNSSGGKDSTVVTELALIVARERGELPLRVQWLDQECEFEATVHFQEWTLTQRPEINGEWYQIPFKLFNATNHQDAWLNVWDEDPAVEWVRPKHPAAIHVNDFGEDRFVKLLRAIGNRTGGALLTGVRAEESATRRIGLTTFTNYKWITWGTKKDCTNHFVFHPIYDWTWRDVWKAIGDGDDPEHPGRSPWRYNTFYDDQYRYGVPVQNMRVSNYHHETAVHSLFYLQEIEPETYERATRRLQGISTAGHLGAEDFWVKDLPFMFRSWDEYFEYLVDNLVPDPEHRSIYLQHRENLRNWLPWIDRERIAKQMTQAVITNDLYFTKGNVWYVSNRTPEDKAKWEAEQRAVADESAEAIA
jgi:predicted phosphoadenosine phosphosulfate sulfurtransferase